MNYDEMLRKLDVQDVPPEDYDQIKELLEIYKQISLVLGTKNDYRLVSSSTTNFPLDLNAISSTKTAF